MKFVHFLLWSLLLLSSAVLFSQTKLNPEWVISKTSNMGKETQAWGVDIDEEGSVYWPINSNNNNEGLDVICYKYDSNGNELWAQPFFSGGTGAQQSYVCNAKSDALYIGGRQCPILGHICDMQLFKIDKSTGLLEWERTFDFGNNGYDEIDGLVIQGDDIYCGGWGQAVQEGFITVDIGLWKLDTEGNTIWSNHLGEADRNEHLDGHFVVDDDRIYGAGLWDGQGPLNLWNGSSFVGSFSKEDGSLIDSTLFGSPSQGFFDTDNALGMASDGTFLYITGYTILPNKTDWQLFLAKFDKSLNLIWYKDWGGTGNETARAIAVKGGKVYIGGTTESLEFGLSGRRDAVLVVYSDDGEYISSHLWGENSVDAFRDIVVTDETIYLACALGGLANEQDSMSQLLKVDISKLTSTQDNYKSESNKISISPNPFGTDLYITIREGLELPLSLELYDLGGRRVLQKEVISNNTTINNNLQSGLYVFRLISEGEIIKVGKMVRQ